MMFPHFLNGHLNNAQKELSGNEIAYFFGVRLNSVIGFHSRRGVRVFFGDNMSAKRTQKVPIYPRSTHGSTRRPKA
jgi:hypothetical protein